MASFSVLFIVLAVSNETFFSTTNLLNLLDQQSYILIVAAAGTLVRIGGGIDLSTGATFAFPSWSWPSSPPEATSSSPAIPRGRRTGASRSAG
ncbi:hypothetical protein [Nocardioides sp.]|uniref:hypothetical protein n=1 Tax=Nocardioides sp. TaxID=35761 RepID=UPI003784A6CD